MCEEERNEILLAFTRSGASGILLSTHTCLPHSHLCAHLLINYDLPHKKEAQLKRVQACLADADREEGAAASSLADQQKHQQLGPADGGGASSIPANGGITLIVISFLHSPQQLKTMVGYCGGLPVKEIPLDVSELRSESMQSSFAAAS
eukprot:scaffold5081_cov430-Prasinococcus_capsulatus_cf.AAC.7